MRTSIGSADRTVPDDLADRIQTAFGFDEPPATFAEWADRMVETFEASLDRDLQPDDLCAVDSSNHAALIGDDVRYYRCALDAVIVGWLVDEPVTVRSEPPTSATVVRIVFDDDGVAIEPPGSVMAFGIDDDVRPPDGPVSLESMYGTLCPHGHVFPSADDYDAWARDTAAVTTAVPVADGVAIAQALLNRAGLDVAASG